MEDDEHLDVNYLGLESASADTPKRANAARSRPSPELIEHVDVAIDELRRAIDLDQVVSQCLFIGFRGGASARFVRDVLAPAAATSSRQLVHASIRGRRTSLDHGRLPPGVRSQHVRPRSAEGSVVEIDCDSQDELAESLNDLFDDSTAAGVRRSPERPQNTIALLEVFEPLDERLVRQVTALITGSAGVTVWLHTFTSDARTALLAHFASHIAIQPTPAETQALRRLRWLDEHALARELNISHFALVGGVCAPDAPSWKVVVLEQFEHLMRDPQKTSTLVRPDVLLVCATEPELHAVLQTFGIEDPSERVTTVKDRSFLDLGAPGGARTLLALTGMGSTGMSGSTVTVSRAIDVLSPRRVVMVGIAFGVKRKKQTMGDVLIAERLVLYEPRREGTGPDGSLVQVPRGAQPEASGRLLQRLRLAALGLPEPFTTHRGLVATGEKLVDNVDARNELVKTYPDLIGGEMEGAGVYSAAADANVDWAIVKGICDWADGRKGYRKGVRQDRAARNAAILVHRMLLQGGWGKPRTDSKP
jgi:nucleoside phosphorylase